MNAIVTPSLDVTDPLRASRVAVWSGRVLTGLIAAFLLVDAAAKLVPLAPVVEGSAKLGIGIGVVRWLGVVLLASTLLHLSRRTQLVGAVLVSAYLGGATATHVIHGSPYWFPVVMGVLLWIAYGLRSAELRSLVVSAFRSSTSSTWSTSPSSSR